jgi:hypothetical protein
MTVANSHGASSLILDMLAGTGSDVDNRRGEESAARDTTDSQKIRQVDKILQVDRMQNSRKNPPREIGFIKPPGKMVKAKNSPDKLGLINFRVP